MEVARSPEELLAEWRSTRSESAFSQLRNQYIRAWVKHEFRPSLGLNWHDAAELECTISLKLSQNPDFFNPSLGTPLKGYIYGWAKNLAIGTHRDNSRWEKKRKAGATAEEYEDGDDVLELRNLLIVVLDGLTPHERAAIVAWQQASGNGVEAADKLGVNYKTFHARLTRARAHARRIVENSKQD